MPEKWKIIERLCNDQDCRYRYVVLDEDNECVSAHHWEEDALLIKLIPNIIEILTDITQYAEACDGTLAETDYRNTISKIRSVLDQVEEIRG